MNITYILTFFLYTWSQIQLIGRYIDSVTTPTKANLENALQIDQ